MLYQKEKVMKKIMLLLVVSTLCGCAMSEAEPTWEDPDFNYIVSYTHVVKKSPDFVTYEYKDIGVDEIAPIAAIYCHDRGGKQASLYEITMQPDNARRATFVCKKMIDY